MNALLGWLWVFVWVLLYGIYVSTFKVTGIMDHPWSEVNENILCGLWGLKPLQAGGLKSREEILNSVSHQGIDYVVLSYSEAHHTPPPMGYYRSLMVIHGVEVQYLDDSYLWIPGRGWPREPITEEFLDRLVEPSNEDVIVWLNPWDAQGYPKNLKTIPEGITAISLFSLKSLGQDVITNRLGSALWSLWLYGFNPDVALLRLYDIEPRLWEGWVRLWSLGGRGTPIRAIINLNYNAKAIVHPGWVVEFPPLSWVVQSFQNCFIGEQPWGGQIFEKDWLQWLKAVKKARSFWGLAALGSLKAWNWEVRSRGPSSWIWRYSIRAFEGMPVQVRLWKDAQVMKTSSSLSQTWLISEPGRYWMTVHLKVRLPFPEMVRWLLWLVTNPVILN